MLFATGSLAKRIEQAESSLVADMAGAIQGRLGTKQVLIAPIGGGSAVATVKGSPLNKIAGLGFEPIDAEALDAVEREFERRAIPLQIELASLGDTAAGAMLSRRGYLLTGFENVLGLPLTTVPEARRVTDRLIVVTRIRPEEAHRWMDVLITGFSHPDTFDGPVSHEPVNRDVLEQVFEDTSTVPHFVRYLARREGVVMGGASMRMWNGVAQLCGAATLPEHRRQGVQTTLLLERLADAAREGCDIAIVTTQPGSKSQENVQRQGFSLLYTRAILVRSWTAPGQP